MDAQVEILGPSFSNFVRSVMLCCEEKGISYQYGMQLGGQDVGFKSDEHLQLHPFGKIPVLKHGDKVLIETVAICRYLDSVFEGSALQPMDLYQRALVDQWSLMIAGYVDQVLVRQYMLEFVFPKGEGGSIRMDKVQEAQPEVIRVIGLLEQQLADQTFICGEQCSIADLLLAPILDYLIALPHIDTLMSADSVLKGYVQQMRERPSGQTVLRPMNVK